MQERQVQEEAAELSVAINHFLRKREGSLAALAEESVDRRRKGEAMSA